VWQEKGTGTTGQVQSIPSVTGWQEPKNIYAILHQHILSWSGHGPGVQAAASISDEPLLASLNDLSGTRTLVKVFRHKRQLLVQIFILVQQNYTASTQHCELLCGWPATTPPRARFERKMGDAC
jgi:hypothetical protein